MKKQIQKYAGVLLASAVVITGVASAANVDPIPSIANTFAVSGQVIKSADLNKLAEGLNILDTRTNNFKNNITVTDAGNVGVGTTTPSAKLDVKDGTAAKSFRYEALGDADNRSIASVKNYNPDGTSVMSVSTNDSANASSVLNLGLQGFTNWNIIAKGSDNALHFGRSGGFALEQGDFMTITDGGNIGIGTTTPGQKLEINGDMKMNNTSLSKWIMNITKLGSGSYNSIAADGDSGIIFSTDGDPAVENNNGFIIAPHAYNTSGLKIMENGNIGIGTSTPTEKLEVAGKIKSASTVSTDAGTTVVTKDYLSNLPAPVAAQDAATKSYVDAAVAAAGGGGIAGGPDVILGCEPFDSNGGYAWRCIGCDGIDLVSGGTGTPNNSFGVITYSTTSPWTIQLSNAKICGGAN